MSTSPRPASSARAIFLITPLSTSDEPRERREQKGGLLRLSPRTLSDTRAAVLIPFGAKSSKPKIAEHRGRKDYG